MSSTLIINEDSLRIMSIALVSPMKSCISSVNFSRDGEKLAVASLDGTLKIFNTNDIEQVNTFYCKKYGIEQVMFTHHPNAILHTSNNSFDDSIRYMSIHTNQYIRYFRGHTDRVISMDFSSVDDSFLSGSLDGTVRLWDLRTPECQAIMRCSGTKNRPLVAYDPMGMIFASSTNQGIKLFDLRKLESGPFSTISLDGSLYNYTSLKFDQAGKNLLLTTSQASLQIYDSYSGKKLHTFTDYKNDNTSIIGASFSPNSKYVFSGSEDGTVYCWSLESGKKICEWIQAHAGPIRCIAWNPVSMVMASSCSNLAIWIPDKTKIIREEGEVG